MAKKVTQVLKADLTKNTLVEKGGAWLLDINIRNEGAQDYILNHCSAWANPSAAKRYLKTVVLSNTPRKSIKMAITKTTVEDKPLKLEGELTYKVDA
jgi:hypothetical protein